MARHEDRATLGTERRDEVPQLLHALGVETVGGLVEDEQRRILQQRRRQREPLLHPERVLRDPVVGALARARRGAARRRPRCGPMPWIRPSTSRLRRPERYGNSAGLSTIAPMRGMTVCSAGPGGDTEHRGATAAGAHEAEQHADRRRLAGAVRSEEAEDAALGHGEIEPADRDLAAVDLAEAFGLDDCPHLGAHPTGGIPSTRMGADDRPPGHRRGPGGRRGRDHGRRRRAARSSSSTAPPSPRQDVRRRPHHRRAALVGGARRARSTRSARRSPVRDVVLVAPSGRHITLPLPADRRARPGDAAGATSTPRWSTGRRAAGAELGSGRRSPGSRSARPASRPRSPTERCSHAPFAVAADGHYSTARKLLTPDAPPVRGEWSAFRQYFTRRRRPATVGPVRTRPAARLRLGVPAPRRARQRRVRDAARPRRHRQVPRAHLARPAGPPVGARHPRPARRAGVTAPRLADPEPPGSGAPRPRPGALRRRRRGRRRRDDGRGHRAGARDRRARRRTPRLAGDATGPGARPATAPTSTAPSAGTCASRPRLQRVLAHPAAPSSRSGPSTSPTGPAGTSPAGCSRTIPARSCSRRTAGTAACSRRRGVCPPARQLRSLAKSCVRQCSGRA